MPNDAILTIRCSADDLERADALRARLAKHPAFRTLGKVTRAGVIRLALAEGLDALEVAYPADGGAAGGRKGGRGRG